MTLNKIIQASTPVVAAVLLYVAFGYLGIVDSLRLGLSACMALTAASFAQAATLASLSGTRWYRSPALRKFGSDFAVSAAVAVPIAVLLHARYLYSVSGIRLVFNPLGWTAWLVAGGGVKTLFVSFVFVLGIASLGRLFINRFAKKKMT